MTIAPGAWEFWIDRGGTFTDIVARAPDGQIRVCKLLSANPAQYADAALEGIRRLRASYGSEAPIASVRMGTTVGTNALLERRGEPTALVVTAGFKDVLRIGSQSRPQIFALDIRLPEMLYTSVVEADERVSADGEILRPLDTERLRDDLEALRARGIASLAIALLHGYRHPSHEQACAAVAAQIGFTEIAMSHAVSPTIKLVPRADTTLVDAYLSPLLHRHAEGLRAGLSAESAATRLYFMQSNGRLAEAAAFRGKDSILSGPAGGVVGMAASARSAGIEQLIGFDMGGTSTDVCLYDGRFERSDRTVVAGVRIAVPMLRIHTIAAGGGSVLHFSSGRPQVGPQSAGAIPGPTCYRMRGPLTITDANVALGRIQPDYFPHSFGTDARQPIDVEAVHRAFAALCREIRRETGVGFDPPGLALGFLRIAVERMALAIKHVSVRQGHDPSAFTLCCFGGAAGQHACQVAEALGMERIWLHPLAGVLSAYGMGLADLGALRRTSFERRLDGAAALAIDAEFSVLERHARAELGADGSAESVMLERSIELRVEGTDAGLELAWPGAAAWTSLRPAFAAAYRARFGYEPPAQCMLVAATLALEARLPGHGPTEPERAAPSAPPTPEAIRTIHFAIGELPCPIFRREALTAGCELQGPALIAEQNSTTIVDPDWRAEVDRHGHLLLRRLATNHAQPSAIASDDPVQLEIFGNRFMHVAEEMGGVLEQTARSVNIRERLDFSCAIFDSDGDLIANAPHIPVHLGSMGDTVREVLRRHGNDLRPGDAFVSNAPYSGGTHLPDITAVTPVFAPGERNPSFTVACRAHHADVGGTTPGSMPASSRRIEEEGVLLDAVRVVRDGVLDRGALRSALAAGPYPARNPEQNIADLEAQLAANQKGAAALEHLVELYTLPTVLAYMRALKANAEECVRRCIACLDDGRFEVELDGGERIAVDIAIDRVRRQAVLDFAGSSPMSPRNFNAPAAVARAAVLYVFRTLVAEDIPLNAGCFRPLTILLPPGSVLDPRPPAAVVAGNVETSQCIVDALLAALGACAAAQGTMNNLSFGCSRFQYYETIGGGAGAGPDFDGASGVQTHMTNSRLTDPEILELLYPVRVLRFELRRGSGGSGRTRGGDGLRREIEFLAALRLSVLSNRRRSDPFGLAGGRAGQRGCNVLVRCDGSREILPAVAEREVHPGDRILIETPGGGGYGAPMETA